MKIKRGILLIFLFATVLFGLFQCTSQRNRKALQANAVCLQDSVIIIDAGHGGLDGGTVAADGTVEKEINLLIAEKLNSMLQLNGIRTRMTRTDDDSIHDPDAKSARQKKITDIHNRTRIVNETDNAILVSIHQNHFTQSQYHGTQVFYSGNHPQSEALAQAIRQSVVRHIQPQNEREIKKSGTEIYLLYHAQKPSVMVECGFFSNAAETELLKTPSYQQKMALAIYNGIIDFFNDAEEV